jgi:alpha-galactosidase
MPKRTDRRTTTGRPRGKPGADETECPSLPRTVPRGCDTGCVGPREIRLDSGVIERVVSLAPTISTTSFRLKGDDRELVRAGSPELALVVDGVRYDGASGWLVVSTARTDEPDGSTTHRVHLAGDGLCTPEIEIELVYVLYPGMPVVRKRLSLRNIGDQDLCIEAVDVESLAVGWSDTHAWTLADHGRQRRLGPYEGTVYDPLILVHDIGGRRGLFLGNEAPGVTRRSATFEGGHGLSAGLTHPHQPYPFRAWLAPGERWESPAVFTGAYRDSDDPRVPLNGPVSDFVRRHLGLRLLRGPELPGLVYNTWNPFRTAVSDGLVRELATAAAGCGADVLVIDDGWQAGRGDWKVDPQKFPGGLGPTFDHVRSLGMKPGLWISLAEADRDSVVFKEHPEWFVRDAKGEPTSIHTPGPATVTACLATGWYDHIRDLILGLVHEHGLAYVKLDLSVAASAYLYDTQRTGCHAKDHPGHRDREESFLVIYRRCQSLFDELSVAAPELFIDCTFEAWSMLQLVDYGLVQHAHGDWLANIEQPAPRGSLRVRHLAWWRAPAMPASALVIGNQTLDDPGRELALLSVAGTLPLLLGDPRQVPEAKRARLRRWVHWLTAKQQRHEYNLFRQDLPGFGEPMEGQWDGWARINTETRSGGILGVFRQGGAERERTVTIPGLDPHRVYVVRRGPSGRKVARGTGSALAKRGFSVVLRRRYSAALFEVVEANP